MRELRLDLPLPEPTQEKPKEKKSKRGVVTLEISPTSDNEFKI